MRGIRVRGWGEDDPGGPGNATVGRFREAEFLSGGLETGPRNVDVVLAFVNGVRSHCQPFLITAIVDRRDNGVVPVQAVGGAIYGNGPVAIKVLAELGVEEISVSVDVDARIAKTNWNSAHARKESGRKGLPAIGRSRKAAELNAIEHQSRPVGIGDDVQSGGAIVG